jgi:DNA polymerase-3 subunit delta'
MFGGVGESLHLDADDPVFRRVAARGHADFFVVERTVDPKATKNKTRVRTQIAVDDVRRLGGFLNLTPAEGGWRVAIIDAADEMNRSSVNAVLKVVEEPPARALILIVSHAPGRLPATLRSRCRRLALAPLAADQVATVLARLRPDLDVETTAALARIAEGSPGRAMALAEHGGLELYRDMIGLLAGLPELDIRALHALGDKLARRGAEAAHASFMDMLLRWIARVVLAGARGAVPEEIVAGEAAAARHLLGAGGLDRRAALWENISRLAARAEAVNLDRKQVVLSAFTAIEGLARG